MKAMKKILIVLFLAFSGFVSNKGSEISFFGFENSQLMWKVSFTGKITGSKVYYFNMELQFNDDNTVWGSYIVTNGARQNVYLKGFYNEEKESIILYEYDLWDKRTGYYFKGAFRTIYSEQTFRCIGFTLDGRYIKDGTKVNWPFKADSYQFGW